MKLTLFIVTFKRDFPYLRYCFRSISKFCSGFHECLVLVPVWDLADVKPLTMEWNSTIPLRFITGNEWAKQGMLWHMYEIMRSDLHCPDADFIAHFDADCVFTKPVSPDTYFKDGKPYLRYEPFESIGKRHPENMVWQGVTQVCLPFPVLHETMRGHPEIYHRGLYGATRTLMQIQTKEPLDVWLKKQRNEFPQTFCEHVTLGNVALQFYRDLYETVQQDSDVVKPDCCFYQAWSHCPPTAENIAKWKELGIA